MGSELNALVLGRYITTCEIGSYLHAAIAQGVTSFQVSHKPAGAFSWVGPEISSHVSIARLKKLMLGSIGGCDWPSCSVPPCCRGEEHGVDARS